MPPKAVAATLGNQRVFELLGGGVIFHHFGVIATFTIIPDGDGDGFPCIAVPYDLAGTSALGSKVSVVDAVGNLMFDGRLDYIERIGFYQPRRYADGSVSSMMCPAPASRPAVNLEGIVPVQDTHVDVESDGRSTLFHDLMLFSASPAPIEVERTEVMFEVVKFIVCSIRRDIIHDGVFW